MDQVISACREALARPGHVLVLTGAGVSAESGIPTFRGKDGYWTIGAREYHPQELATRAAFDAMPWDVWAWYLYRRGVCRAAEPNAGHAAIVRLERALPDRFALITQNVDGLHPRAGSTRVFAIHGDIDQMRCASDCVPDPASRAKPASLHPWRWPVPHDIDTLGKGEPVSASVRSRLVCPRCGGLARPHVLWFDESYDEPRYFLDTTRRLAAAAALLVVAGTSAQTNLPWQIVSLARRAGATIVDVNVEDNPFGELATHVVRAPAAISLTRIADALI